MHLHVLRLLRKYHLLFYLVDVIKFFLHVLYLAFNLSRPVFYVETLGLLPLT